jgi:hypothetical protein
MQTTSGETTQQQSQQQAAPVTSDDKWNAMMANIQNESDQFDTDMAQIKAANGVKLASASDYAGTTSDMTDSGVSNMAVGTIGPAPGFGSNLQAIGTAWLNGKLSASEALSMAWDNAGYAYRGSDTAQGAMQIAGGTGEVLGAIGITSGSGGLGAVAGVPLAFHGGDNIGTGLDRILYGEPQQTATYSGVYSLTGSSNIAHGVDVAIPLVFGTSAGAAALVDGMAGTFPIQYQYFYRGDSVLRSEFLSPMAQSAGADVTQSFLSSESTGVLADVRAEHGVASAGSPYIGVSTNPEVANYFARGPLQDQGGFVTVFRVPQSEASQLAMPNFDNPMAFEMVNPKIGVQESEYLFQGQIPQKYMFTQYPVAPK